MLMRAWKRKLRKNKGFTLVEMLIVVAIIAILIAVSIPLVNGALDRARCATDAANERAAKAAMTILYLTEDVTVADLTNGSDENFYLYDGETGKLIRRTGEMSGSTYMKDNYTTFGQSTLHDHKDTYLWVRISAEGTVQLAWSKSAGGTAGMKWNENLCSAHILSGT